MATEYTVALRNLVSGPAKDARRDAIALRGVLGEIESKPTTVRGRGTNMRRIADDWQKMAAQADKAHAKEAAAAVRAAQRTEAAQARAAAQSIRQQERATAARERLMAREVAARERAERQMLAAELRRIRTAQRAERTGAMQWRRYQTAVARKDAGGSSVGIGSAIAAGGPLGLAAGISGKLLGGVYQGIGYAAGEALDTAKQIEGARMRLTALLGSEGAAKAEIKDMVRLAGRTKFVQGDLIDATSSLSASFSDTGARREVLGRLMDAVTVSGGGKEQLDQVVLAVNQVVGKGKLEAEELNQLIEPLKGVVGRKEFYLRVAKLMNVSGKDEQSVIDKMQKLQKAGSIKSDIAVKAVGQVIGAKTGNQRAGAFAEQAGDTLEGQISNIKSGLSTLFASAEMETWPAFVALRGFLGDIAKFFDVDSARGKIFIDGLRSGLNKLIPVIDFLRDSFNYLTQDEEFISQITAGIGTLATAATVAGAAVFYMGAGLVETIGRISQFFGAAYDIGRNLVIGIADGIAGAVGYVYEALTNLATGMVQTIKSKLSISSPSRVMMQLGGYTGEGFARGIEGGARRVESAGRMLGDAATAGASSRYVAAASSGGAGGGHYQIIIQNTLPVQTAANAAELVRDAGPLLDARTEATLDRYFGRLAAQGV